MMFYIDGLILGCQGTQGGVGSSGGGGGVTVKHDNENNSIYR